MHCTILYIYICALHELLSNGIVIMSIILVKQLSSLSYLTRFKKKRKKNMSSEKLNLLKEQIAKQKKFISVTELHQTKCTKEIKEKKTGHSSIVRA